MLMRVNSNKVGERMRSPYDPTSGSAMGFASERGKPEAPADWAVQLSGRRATTRASQSISVQLTRIKTDGLMKPSDFWSRDQRGECCLITGASLATGVPSGEIGGSFFQSFLVVSAFKTKLSGFQDTGWFWRPRPRSAPGNLGHGDRTLLRGQPEPDGQRLPGIQDIRKTAKAISSTNLGFSARAVSNRRGSRTK